jgi:hypothetical protein
MVKVVALGTVAEIIAALVRMIFYGPVKKVPRLFNLVSDLW